MLMSIKRRFDIIEQHTLCGVLMSIGASVGDDYNALIPAKLVCFHVDFVAESILETMKKYEPGSSMRIHLADLLQKLLAADIEV